MACGSRPRSGRPQGATLRVFGDVAGQRTELLRFDDFIDGPHYHVPAAGPSIAFDREKLGEPLDWIVASCGITSLDLLTTAGLRRDSARPSMCRRSPTTPTGSGQAMEDCVPAGYVRVAGRRAAAGRRLRPALDRPARSTSYAQIDA